MKIVFFSDTHGLHRKINLPTADILVFTGDLTNKGCLGETRKFMEWFSEQDSKYKVMIAGNHDFSFEKFPEKVKDLIPENINYLQDSGCEIEGIKFWGSPVTPYFHNWAFNRVRSNGSDKLINGIKQHWNMIPDDTDILLTHGPSYGIRDRVSPKFKDYNVDMNCGCKDLTEALLRVKPSILAFGHIHEAYGIYEDTVNEVLHINSSILNEAYEATNLPIIVEWCKDKMKAI